MTSSTQSLLGLVIDSCLNLDWPKLIFAALVGMLGSAAYITALYFRFIGSDLDEGKLILEPFLNSKGRLDLRKCAWYCLVGGGIAGVFQNDVPVFVAVQSLILGATWPAVVSQFLSGKMANASKKDRASVESIKNKPRAQKTGSQQVNLDRLFDELEEKVKSSGKTKVSRGKRL